MIRLTRRHRSFVLVLTLLGLSAVLAPLALAGKSVTVSLKRINGSSDRIVTMAEPNATPSLQDNCYLVTTLITEHSDGTSEKLEVSREQVTCETDPVPSPSPSSAPALSPSPPSLSPAPAPSPSPPSNFSSSAGWKVRCAFDHRLSDDPIVFPNDPGASHSHDFMGNRATDALSTQSSLETAETTCRLKEDRAAYWFPTVYQNGVTVDPALAPENVTPVFYYRTRVRSTSIKPFPPGLKVIAGATPHATAPLSNYKDIVYWSCNPSDVGTRSAVPPGNCHSLDGASGFTDLHVIFPQCWDGVHLDSPDHRSHMAYPIETSGGQGFRCPTSHPVIVPELRLRMSYALKDGGSVTLSSGPAYTAHADFWNVWDQPKLATLTHDCLAAGVDCKALKS
jgi:hypothetical protein